MRGRETRDDELTLGGWSYFAAHFPYTRSTAAETFTLNQASTAVRSCTPRVHEFSLTVVVVAMRGTREEHGRYIASPRHTRFMKRVLPASVPHDKHVAGIPRLLLLKASAARNQILGGRAGSNPCQRKQDQQKHADWRARCQCHQRHHNPSATGLGYLKHTPNSDEKHDGGGCQSDTQQLVAGVDVWIQHYCFVFTYMYVALLYCQERCMDPENYLKF